MIKPMTRIATCLLTLVAVTTGAAAAEQQHYLIGCSLPLSGRMVGFGGPIKAGIELQCDDSKGDPKETINIAQRLIDNPKVIASISDFTSTATMAAAETYKKGELLQITPSASHPDLTKMNKWMFRASLTTPIYIRPSADFIIDKLKVKRAAVIQVQTDWGQSVGEVFDEQFKKRGGEIVMHEIYNEGHTDFRAIITQIRRLKPDVIFLGMLEEEAPNFMKQMQQFGLTQPVVDSSVGITPRSIKLGGPAMNGIYAMTLFNDQSKDPVVQDFAKRFRAKAGGQTPDIWAAYGFDAGTLVMDAAIRAMPNVTRATVRDQLAQTHEFHGANGVVSINPNTREIERSKVTFTQVKDGVQVPVD
jgi:branched-chain amino acid transport system substrate-binding protein